MKKHIAVVAGILLLVAGAALGSGVNGGGSGTATIGDNTVDLGAKALDESLDLSASPAKITGALPKANGGWGAAVDSASGIPFWASGTVTWDTLAAFLARLGVTWNPADNTWTFLNPITTPGSVSSANDNTRYGNAKNSADPTGAYLAAGNYWTRSDEAMRLRNQDNTATNILASAYQYRNFVFDNSAMDNMALLQDLPFTEVWDNMVFSVRGYVDGKITGAATDNVTTNLYCCAATDNTLAQCTKMFTSDPVPTGAAVLSPAINNGTCNAGSEIRISFTGINMSAKKLHVRSRCLRR